MQRLQEGFNTRLDTHCQILFSSGYLIRSAAVHNVRTSLLRNHLRCLASDPSDLPVLWPEWWPEAHHTAFLRVILPSFHPNVFFSASKYIFVHSHQYHTKPYI